MKVGEVKLEALVLMNVANENKLELSKYNTYLNENKYKKYLLNMDESINRAIDLINTKLAIKEVSLDLKNLIYESRKNYIILSLNQIDNFSKIKKIILLDDQILNLSYEIIADDLIIYGSSIENIKIIYYPKIKHIKLDLENELPMPDYLARIIPYFIKYDLYQEDEPSLAIVAKTNFDNLLDSYCLTNESQQGYIEKIFEV